MTMRAEEKKGKMSVAEAGRRGGQRTAKTQGREFYEQIGRKGGEKVTEERGPEFFREIGRKGGESRGNRNVSAKGASGRKTKVGRR